MTRGKANSIVNDFFRDMNPTYWNGTGNKPSSFDTRVWEYSLQNGVSLDISFENNGIEGWCHYCELVDEASNEIMECLSGYGIDSALNLVDTVMDLCREYD